MTCHLGEKGARKVVEPGGPHEVLNCVSVCSVTDTDELACRVDAAGGVLTCEPAAEEPMHGGGVFDDSEALAELQ